MHRRALRRGWLVLAVLAGLVVLSVFGYRVTRFARLPDGQIVEVEGSFLGEPIGTIVGILAAVVATVALVLAARARPDR